MQSGKQGRANLVAGLIVAKKLFIIKPNLNGYTNVIDYLKSILDQNKSVTVEIEEGERKKRSLSANALQAVWITEIAGWQGHSEKYVRNYVKAELALPILLEDEERDIVKKIKYTLAKIDYDFMSPGQRIEVMDMFNVTSILSTKQHTRFRKEMQAHYLEMDLILEVR